jgi:hypothetical protein
MGFSTSNGGDKNAKCREYKCMYIVIDKNRSGEGNKYRDILYPAWLLQT